MTDSDKDKMLCNTGALQSLTSLVSWIEQQTNNLRSSSTSNAKPQRYLNKFTVEKLFRKKDSKNIRL